MQSHRSIHELLREEPKSKAALQPQDKTITEASEQEDEGEKLAYYLAFFVLQCMANALTLALFGAQAFGEHVPCLSALGHNLTARFEALFFAGFILHATIFSI